MVLFSVTGEAKEGIEPIVSTEWLAENLDRENLVIIDIRSGDAYAQGHIPNARSLPTPWMWNEDGTYKSIDTLKEMAAGVIGKQGKREIIVYCGVGGYASSWWFVLGRVLGYDKVRLYDGSAEEWTRNNEMVKYTWTR